MTKFVQIDSEGEILGWFDDNYNSSIPVDAFTVSDEDHAAVTINYPTHFIDGVFTRVAPTPPPLTPEEVTAEIKATGVEIQGSMISLNESNQNGLAAISTMIDKAILLNKPAFPVYPSLETKTGKARLVATNQDEFDLIFLTFGLARQQFFL